MTPFICRWTTSITSTRSRILGPAELIERLDAADSIRVIPFEGTAFVPTSWLRETFPFESMDMLCQAIEEVAREAWAQYNHRN